MNHHLGVVLAAGAALLSTMAAADEVTLTAVAFLPPAGDGTQAAHITEFVNRLNAAGAGEIQINILGGPEALAASEQPNAVATGAVDMVFTALTFYHNRLPLNDYYTVTTLNPVERRELGIHDYLNELHAGAMNTRVLADYLYTAQNVYYFGHLDQARVDRIAQGDLSGLRMRGGPPYAALFAALGIENFPIAPPDIYTAIERSTVDGYAWPSIDMIQQGWGEITGYRLDHPYNHGSSNLQINLDRWNDLTPTQQDILTTVAEEWERWSFEDGVARNDAEAEAQRAAGVEFIAFTPEAAAAFDGMVRAVHWESLRQYHPDAYDRLSQYEPVE